MGDYSQEFMYTSGDFPDSPTLGIGKNEAVAEIANWLQEPTSTFQPISPSSDAYDEDKEFTILDNVNVEMDFLSQSIQDAGITSEFPQLVAGFNFNSGDIMNHNIQSSSVSSFNDTAEVMGIQNTSMTIPCNDTIMLSYDADMMSNGSSSPKVLSVSPHPQYFDLPGPSSVESTSSAASNSQRALKSGRKRRTRAPKKKLYEIEEKFDDPNEERKRLNAIKAHRNRQKKGGVFSNLEKENSILKSSLVEKNALIAQLQKKILDINNTRSSESAKLQQIRKIVNEKVVL